MKRKRPSAKIKATPIEVASRPEGDALYLDRGRPGIAYRLRLVRHLLGIQQGEFAESIGLKPSTYNQYEKEKADLPVPVANLICDKHKQLSLDWIYRGDTSAVKKAFADLLDNAHKMRTQQKADD